MHASPYAHKAAGHDRAACPRCGTENEMPKVTRGGGASNAKARPGEPGYIAPKAAPQAVSEPEDAQGSRPSRPRRKASASTDGG